MVCLSGPLHDRDFLEPRCSQVRNLPSLLSNAQAYVNWIFLGRQGLEGDKSNHDHGKPVYTTQPPRGKQEDLEALFSFIFPPCVCPCLHVLGAHVGTRVEGWG